MSSSSGSFSLSLLTKQQQQQLESHPHQQRYPSDLESSSSPSAFSTTSPTRGHFSSGDSFPTASNAAEYINPFLPFGSTILSNSQFPSPDAGGFAQIPQHHRTGSQGSGVSGEYPNFGPYTPSYAASFASSRSSLSNVSPSAIPSGPTPFDLAQAYSRLQSLGGQVGEDYDPRKEDSYRPLSASAVSTERNRGSVVGDIFAPQSLANILASSPTSSQISSHQGSPNLVSAPSNNPSPFFEAFNSTKEPASLIPELDLSLEPMTMSASVDSQRSPPILGGASSAPKLTSPPLTLSIPDSDQPEIHLTTASPLDTHPKEGFSDGAQGGQRKKGKNTLEMERLIEELVPNPQSSDPRPLTGNQYSIPPGQFVSPEQVQQQPDRPASSEGGPDFQPQSTNPRAPGFIRAPKRQRSKSDPAIPTTRPDYLGFGGLSALMPSQPFVPETSNSQPQNSIGISAAPTGSGYYSPHGYSVNPQAIFSMDTSGPEDTKPQIFSDASLDPDSMQPSLAGRRRSNPSSTKRPSPYDTTFLSPHAVDASIKRSKSTGLERGRHTRSHSDTSSVRSMGWDPVFTHAGYLAPPGMPRPIVAGQPSFIGAGHILNDPAQSAAMPFTYPAPFFNNGDSQQAFQGFSGPPGSSHSPPSSVPSPSHSPPVTSVFGPGPGSPSSQGSSPGSNASQGGSRGRAGSGAIDYASKTTQATKNAAIQRRKPGTVARFKCEYCGETFTRHYNLKGHVRAHRNEKPYVCEFPGCEKAFARAHDRKRHQLLHTGEKKYKCDVCQTAFVRLDALQRHHKSENGQQCVQILTSRGATFNEDGVMTTQPHLELPLTGPSGGVLV